MNSDRSSNNTPPESVTPFHLRIFASLLIMGYVIGIFVDNNTSGKGTLHSVMTTLSIVVAIGSAVLIIQGYTLFDTDTCPRPSGLHRLVLPSVIVLAATHLANQNVVNIAGGAAAVLLVAAYFTTTRY